MKHDEKSETAQIVNMYLEKSNKESFYMGWYDTNLNVSYYAYRVRRDYITFCSYHGQKTMIVELSAEGNWRVFTNEMDKWEEITQTESGCIDLDTDGRRWEGGIKDGKPFGCGIFYDSEGRKEFKGYVLDGSRICHGEEYYPDIGKTKYSGFYYNDKRSGTGFLYNRKGEIDHNGPWWNDEPYVIHSTDRFVINQANVLIIPPNSFNNTTVLFSTHYLYSVKQVTVGECSMGKIRRFCIDGMEALESIIVGVKSFTRAKNGDELRETEEFDGKCVIRNCPKLASIWFRNYAFADYDSFTLENVPSLASIEIGVKCFWAYASFELRGRT